VQRPALRQAVWVSPGQQVIEPQKIEAQINKRNRGNKDAEGQWRPVDEAVDVDERCEGPGDNPVIEELAEPDWRPGTGLEPIVKLPEHNGWAGEDRQSRDKRHHSAHGPPARD